MKKIYFLLAMLMLTVSNAVGQPTHYAPETGTNTLNAAAIKSKADAGTLYVTIMNHTTSSNKYLNKTGSMVTSFSEATVWQVESYNDGYALKNIDGKYINNAGRPVTLGDDISSATLFIPTDCEANVSNIASGYNSSQAVRWKLKSDNNTQMNSNGTANDQTTTVMFNSGTGNWTCLFTYEVSLKYQATVNCKHSATDETFLTFTYLVDDGEEILAPDFINPYISNDASQTVDGKDENFDFHYTLDHSNNKCYYIYNYRGTWAVGKGANVVNSTTELNLAPDASDVKQQFALIYYDATDDETDNGNYYLYSVGESKFAYADGTKLSLAENFNARVEASPVTFGFSTSSKYKSNEPLLVKIGGNTYGVSTDYSPDVYLYNKDDDAGNATSIVEADDFDATDILEALDAYFHPSYFVTYVVKDENGETLMTSEPIGTTLDAKITTLPAEYQITNFYTYNTVDVTISEQNTTVEFIAILKETPNFKFTADATSPVWHKLKIKDANYPTYVADGTPNVTSPKTDADDYTVQWAFIGNPYAGFTIINRAAGTDLVLGSASAKDDGNNGGNTYATLAAAGTQTYEKFFAYTSDYLTNGFFLFNAEDDALNQRSEENLAYWTNGHDKGSTFVAEEILEGEALFNTLIAELKTIPFGTGLNQYSFTNSYAGYTSQAATIISGLEAQGYTEDNLEIAQALLANKELNKPTAGQYLRIKGSTNSQYIGSGSDSNNKYSRTDSEDEALVYFDGTTLRNVSTGKYFHAQGTWSWADKENAQTISFVEGVIGKYAIKCTSSAGYVYLYDGDDCVDRGSDVDPSSPSTNSRYTSWILESAETPTANMRITDAGWGTFCATFAVEIPEGVKAYTGEMSEDKTWIRMNELTEGIIPANTGVVVAKEVEGDAFSADLKPSALQPDLIIPTCYSGNTTSEIMNVPAGAYLLQKNLNTETNEYVVGWYKVEGEGFTLAPNRCYLAKNTVPEASQARSFIGFEPVDDATGISSIATEAKTKADGKYMVNGQIVVVKAGKAYNMSGTEIK